MGDSGLHSKTSTKRDRDRSLGSSQICSNFYENRVYLKRFGLDEEQQQDCVVDNASPLTLPFPETHIFIDK